MTSLPIAIARCPGAHTDELEDGLLDKEGTEAWENKWPREMGIEVPSGDVRSEGVRRVGVPTEDEPSLRLAFLNFAQAAGTLERSYTRLRSEVERLHRELAQSRFGWARSREENREIRRHLDRILEGLPCGVLVAGSDGAISAINPEGRRLLGALSESGQACAEPWGEAGKLALAPGLLDLLARSRRVSAEQEQRFDDGNGSSIWLAARHAAVPQPATREAVGTAAAATEGMAEEGTPEFAGPCQPAESGSPPVSIFILRDISEAKNLLEEREKGRREQALAEMSATLAHEIRNPLGSMELFAGLLAGAGLPAECEGWVEQVQAGLRTLAATVNNVLHFHSLPALERMPTEMGRLLDWAGGFLVPMARQADVELRMRNRLAGVWLAADRHRLEQVLLNLVLNALRAVSRGGWVEVSGKRAEGGRKQALVIAVSDSGRGIAPYESEALFAPGFSTRPGGPGLGLAVSRKIVEQHGGSLGAANRAGAGACFTMTLPWAEDKLGKNRAGENELARAQGMSE
jgi:signal transduction histidine kinase